MIFFTALDCIDDRLCKLRIFCRLHPLVIQPCDCIEGHNEYDTFKASFHLALKGNGGGGGGGGGGGVGHMIINVFIWLWSRERVISPGHMHEDEILHDLILC